MGILILFGMYLIDQPDIEFLDHGMYWGQLRVGPAGGVIGYGKIGLWNRLDIGMSYGASNLIGVGAPGFYKQWGLRLRILLTEQNIILPTIIMGFDNQGYGEYDSLRYRYDIMSKGIYSQVGQSFDYPNLKITPNIGVNYSFEQDRRFDMFGGIKFEIGSTHIMVDYSPNFSDPQDKNKGYLNTGIRFVFWGQSFFEFALRDLLDNSSKNQQLNRIIKIGYQASF